MALVFAISVKANRGIASYFNGFALQMIFHILRNFNLEKNNINPSRYIILQFIKKSEDIS